MSGADRDRRLRSVAAAVALLLASCVSGSGSPPQQAGQGACSLPRRLLQRIVNGHHDRRSGDLYIVSRPYHSFAFDHSAPWDYLQRVPMLLYGPSHVPPVGAVERPVTMPDLAPTLAGYLGFDFRAPDGRPMREALLPPGDRGEPPRLIVVVVLDGAGRNVLSEWPNAWPVIRGLIPRGAWFTRAEAGSSPSVTPPVHTTLGTGAYPRRHGLVDLDIRVGADLEPSYARGPRYLEVPTLADLYDRSRGNAPQVGLLAFRDWHLGMSGHGSFLEGGDRDLAALLDHDTGAWALEGENARYFRFPPYVNDVPGLRGAIEELDAGDGERDGRWMGERVVDHPATWRRSPAFAWWQTQVLDEVIRREGFGADPVPDLLFTNFKQVDEVGHRWSMNSPQMAAAVRASDRAVGDLVRILDRRVGRGRWVMAVTADHGSVPDPEVSGGFSIDKEEFVADVDAAFGRGGPVVQRFRPTQLWLDVARLRANGFSVGDVARFAAGYTRGQNATDPGRLGQEERSRRVFSAAFPSRTLRGLPCVADPPAP